MWYTHWQCQFQSFNGTQYAVNICKQTARVGDIVQLTGAAEPFTTQEDDSDDIFTPIRIQTGYLRVIDPDGTLMADLIPANNTERLVQLWSGTNTDGRFIPSLLRWQGFLQAQAYTQPWDGNAYVLEIPVKSLLGAFEDVSIDETFASAEKNVAALIFDAFDNFGLVADNDLTHLIITSDVSDAPNTLLKSIIQMAVFFDREIVNDEGDSYEQLVGMSYYDALSSVMTLYGLQLREDGAEIYMNQFDGLDVRTWSVGWGYLSYIARGSSIVVTPTTLPSVDMLTALTFKGTGNIVGYNQGGKSAKVVINMSGLDLSITLPQTSETGETPSELNMQNGVVFVQAHTNRIGGCEIYRYESVNVTSKENPNDTYSNTFSYGGPSSYAECLSNCVINKPNYTPMSYIKQGAFPCRWFFRPTDDVSPVVLANGLFLNMQSVNLGLDTPYWSPIYEIRSLVEQVIQDGYIHVEFRQHSFIYSGGNSGYFNSDSRLQDGFLTKMWVRLSVGELYWNGTNWSTDNTSRFAINFKNENIETNKTSDMQVSTNDGWFIPVTSTMRGYVRLSIIGVVESGTDFMASHVYSNSRIISNLQVSFLPNNPLAASYRDTNVYRKNIILSGFSEEKTIETILGTYNNNVPSASFIKSNSSTYIVFFPYIDASATINQRPELHLLDRMVSQFGAVRRTFSGVVQRGVELMQTRYTYLGLRFFGVKDQTNWRDDTEEIKFIEVS